MIIKKRVKKDFIVLYKRIMENNFNSRHILWACKQRDIGLVKFLIKNGEDPFKKIKIGNSYIIPIHFYCTDNRLITENKKIKYIEKIKKILIKRDIAKEFQALFFSEDIRSILINN